MDGKNCLLRAEFAQCYNIKTLQNLLYNTLSLSAGTQFGHLTIKSRANHYHQGGEDVPLFPCKFVFLQDIFRDSV